MKAARPLALLLAWLLCTTPLQAADEATKILAVEFITQPRQIDLPGSSHLAFRIVNATGGSVQLREFRLEVVDSPTALQVGKQCQQHGLPQSQIPSGQAVTVVCPVGTPELSDSFLGFMKTLLSRWSLLTLSPGDYQFIAIVEGRGESASGEEDGRRVSATRAVQVRLVPTVWQSVLGAMLGSMLMVLFWIASRGVSGIPAAGDAPTAQVGGIGRTAVLLWCASTTAASIAIFLTFRMKDASLPFTLTVNDFYGGLVVGLFGVVITKWLGPKLFGPAKAVTR
jgi:hypothetical protein